MSEQTRRPTRAEGVAARKRGARIEPLAAGARIREYVVKDVIASGGFGTVYRVEHSVLARPAALKVLHAELAKSGEAVKRFHRDAQAVNLIRHPNVVDIYDFGELDGGQPFFVMELLRGADLDEHLRRHGRLATDEALAIMEPLCDALAAAHV